MSLILETIRPLEFSILVVGGFLGGAILGARNKHPIKNLVLAAGWGLSISLLIALFLPYISEHFKLGLQTSLQWNFDITLGAIYAALATLVGVVLRERYEMTKTKENNSRRTK